MTTHPNRVFSLVLALTGAALGALGASGCASHKHDMTTAPSADGTVSVCAKCYDTIRTVKASRGGRYGPTQEHAVVTHHCDDCNSDMSVYEKDGVLMARCAHCAPEGVACDRCVPATHSAK